MLGLDRKQMEEERLARLTKKRKAEDASVDDVAAVTSAQKTATAGSNTSSETQPGGKRARLPPRQNSISPPPSRSQQRGSSSKRAESSSNDEITTENTRASSLRFDKPRLLKTWAFGYERTGDDVKFEEIFDKDNLNIAVLSGWCTDFNWVATKLKPGRTKLIWILEGTRESDRAALRRELGESSSCRLCFPPMTGSPFGRMHSKLMLLFFNDFVRVVVPSANLRPHDWGEDGVLENSVFVADLPKLSSEQPTDQNPTLNFFAKELLYFVERSGLHKDARDALLKYDFSATDRIAFIHTIAGTHTGSSAERTGLLGLCQAIRQLGLSASKSDKVSTSFATSSVGALNKDLISQWKSAVRGPDTLKELVKSSESDTFSIIYPSYSTVASSNGGLGAGGVIFLNEKAYEKVTFPRDILREWKSKRAGLLSHNKMMVTTRKDSKTIVYSGSANISPSAWGRISYDKKTGQPKLTAQNWECGVLMESDADSVQPYKMPLTNYAQGTKPWLT